MWFSLREACRHHSLLQVAMIGVTAHSKFQIYGYFQTATWLYQEQQTATWPYQDHQTPPAWPYWPPCPVLRLVQIQKVLMMMMMMMKGDKTSPSPSNLINVQTHSRRYLVPIATQKLSLLYPTPQNYQPSVISVRNLHRSIRCVLVEG
jgi:hypothetical protein